MSIAPVFDAVAFPSCDGTFDSFLYGRLLEEN
jgi:hypothetical protein